MAVLKELILTVSTLEGCGSLERTDFNSFYFGKVGNLERTDGFYFVLKELGFLTVFLCTLGGFNSVYFGRV